MEELCDCDVLCAIVSGDATAFPGRPTTYRTSVKSCRRHTFVDSGDRGPMSAGIVSTAIANVRAVHISETTGGNVDSLRQVPVYAVFDDSAKQTGLSSGINHCVREGHLILH